MNFDVQPITRQQADRLIKSHYLHRWPGVVTATFGLLDGSRIIGACVFALPPRETFKRFGVTLGWELARLFIEDVTPKNTETWFVARCIRWIMANRSEVQILVSYADPSVGHSGIIYRAGNWISDGFTESSKRVPRFDYGTEEPNMGLFNNALKKHSRASHVPKGADVTRLARASKHRFIYWLDGRHEARRQAHNPGVSGPTVGDGPTVQA